MKYKYTTLRRTDDFLDSISPIYEESKIMQAIQDACAKSGLLLERATKEVIEQFFPQTCTFTIALWEESVGIVPDETTPLEQRRAAVLSRRVKLESLTPERMSVVLSTLMKKGDWVDVQEGIGKHTFRVFPVSDSFEYDIKAIVEKIKEIKPSHKSFQIGHEFKPSDLVIETDLMNKRFPPKFCDEIVCGQWPDESTKPIRMEADLVLDTGHSNHDNRLLFPGERETNEPNIHGTLQLERNYADLTINQGNATDIPNKYFVGGDSAEKITGGDEFGTGD